MLSSEIPTLCTCCFEVRLTERNFPWFCFMLNQSIKRFICIFCILSLLFLGRKDDKKKDMRQEYQEMLFGEEKNEN